MRFYGINYNVVEFDSRAGNSLTTFERKSAALRVVLPAFFIVSSAIVKHLGL